MIKCSILASILFIVATSVTATAADSVFDFNFYGITIFNTRSRGSDTDYAFFSVKVGDNEYPLQAKKLGDLNNGKRPKDFPVNIEVKGVPVPNDQTPILLRWNVVNSGHGTADQYKNALSTAGPVAIKEIGGTIPSPITKN